MLETQGSATPKKVTPTAGPFTSGPSPSSSRKSWAWWPCTSTLKSINSYVPNPTRSSSRNPPSPASRPTGTDSGGGRAQGPQSPDPETCLPSAKGSTPSLPPTSPCSPSRGTPPRSPWGPSSTPTGTTLFYSSTTRRPKNTKSRCIIIPTGAPRPSELTSDLCPAPALCSLGSPSAEMSPRLHGMVLVMVLLYFCQE